MKFALSTLLVAMALVATCKAYYPFFPYYNYDQQYIPNQVEGRQLFRSTTTVTRTRTSTFTCTKSVGACGRRRRGIVFDDSDESQFSKIQPSPIQGVEATQEPVREARSANPQLLMMNPSFGPEFMYGSVPPSYGSYVQPRLFGWALAQAFRVITSSFYTTTTTTTTSTPACSSAGPYYQCPNA